MPLKLKRLLGKRSAPEGEIQRDAREIHGRYMGEIEGSSGSAARLVRVRVSVRVRVKVRVRVRVRVSVRVCVRVSVARLGGALRSGDA